jgi:hypothetical protein
MNPVYREIVRFAQDDRWGSDARKARSLFVGRVSVAIFHRGFEIANAFAQALSEIGDFARAKNQQRDCEDDKKFRNTKFAEHLLPPPALAGQLIREPLKYWTA